MHVAHLRRALLVRFFLSLEPSQGATQQRERLSRARRRFNHRVLTLLQRVNNLRHRHPLRRMRINLRRKLDVHASNRNLLYRFTRCVVDFKLHGYPVASTLGRALGRTLPAFLHTIVALHRKLRQVLGLDSIHRYRVVDDDGRRRGRAPRRRGRRPGGSKRIRVSHRDVVAHDHDVVVIAAIRARDARVVVVFPRRHDVAHRDRSIDARARE
mmetsp:Transcript_2776/g.9063  ORF Transcript_2776/g.9063 Transcript_2776/m.9063 type:complete len:212 (-) Transcript_2776:6-641(-)